MFVPISMLLTWFIGMTLFFMRKPFPIMLNIILYMVLVIIITNYTTVMTMNWHIFESTKDPFLFIAFILKRDLIMPLLTIIAINFSYGEKNSSMKLLFLIVILSTMQVMDFLTTYFNIVTYIHWTALDEFLFNFSFLVVGLLIAQVLLWLEKKEKCKV